ncbi:hypothetical protein [Enterococcus faecium]|uniref:Uncharacterized protein n=1 Tax=Enterococcus faecium TaxID=1352 RepID=A0A242B0J5_ENTFC|nr:hypothetical protein [Enterococcus faecium]OTN86714.1 hypothetical protein A5810_002954 [Enterococcus faecium]OTN86761.1 hypothetical protein A5809_002860 [Enterococcus faecium]
MSWRKKFNSFKTKQKKEESFFPSKLKSDKDIIVQKENFEQVKMQFKGVKENEQLLDSAITDQIDQHLFFTHIILEQATNRPLRKNEITIFLETQKYVQLLKDRKKSADELLDMLFELYIKGAIFVGKYEDENTENIGIYYARRGIYSFFKVFIYDISKREKINYE